MMEWSATSGFWITNMISNLAYTRFSLIQPDVEIVRNGLENGFINQIASTDVEALKLHHESKEKAVAYLTKFSGDAGALTFNTYQTAYQNLFMKYMDGNVKYKVEGQQNPKVEQPGYSEPFLRKIAEDTGDKLKQLGHDEH
jgi:dipeptidase